jgi:hypothetical protein
MFPQGIHDSLLMTLTQGVVILLFGRVRPGPNTHDSEQEVRGIGQVPSRTMGQPNQLKQEVAASHLIRDLTPATHASFVTDAFSVGGLTPSPLLHGAKLNIRISCIV